MAKKKKVENQTKAEENKAQETSEATAEERDERLNKAISKVIAALVPPEQLTVSEWADKKRKLSSESSAETGSWRTDRTPYLKEPMDCFNDPKVRRIVLVASSQVGKSEAINNMIGYVIDQDPGSILFVHPTGINAKEYSKLRLAPMIRDTKCLRMKVADAKSRDSSNTIMQKAFPGGILTLCGSSEAENLCSKPIRYLFCDERDRWAVSAGDEGDPLALALTRQLTFYNAKCVEVSTPNIKGSSNIEKSYNLGTKERWVTKCPHCGNYSEIVFNDIHYNKIEREENNEKIIDIENLFYGCPKCGGVSSESEIKRQPSKWVAENPAAYKQDGIRSFWLSSWCSPWAHWRDTILMYLRAIGDSLQMQVVYNTRFGLLWENRGDLESEDELLERREEYNAELPDGVLVLTCGIDTQNDRLEYEVVGHGRFGETWGIKKGIIFGVPDTDEVWEKLDEVLGHVYLFKNGRGLKISRSFIDEGGAYTQEVRLRCSQRLSKKIFPIKGSSGGVNVPYTDVPKKQKIVIKNKYIGSVWWYQLGVDAGKRMIMDALKVKTPGRKYCHFPLRDDYGPAYFKGLLSERYVYKKGHKVQYQWEKIPGHERNEPLDCRNYALAACKSLSPDFDAIAKKMLELPNPQNESAPKSTKPTKPKTRQSQKSKFYDEW